MRTLLLAATAFVILAGCSGDPELRADALSTESEEGRYAIAHRDSVLRFVREGATESERWGRMSGVLSFLRRIESSKTADDVTAVARELDVPGFWKKYEQDHYWAERDVTVNGDRKAELIRSGVRRALRELELELGPR